VLWATNKTRAAGAGRKKKVVTVNEVIARAIPHEEIIPDGEKNILTNEISSGILEGQ